MITDPTAPIATIQVQDPEGALPHIVINRTDFDPAIHTPLEGKSRRKKEESEPTSEPVAKKPTARTSKAKTTKKPELTTEEVKE